MARPRQERRRAELPRSSRTRGSKPVVDSFPRVISPWMGDVVDDREDSASFGNLKNAGQPVTVPVVRLRPRCCVRFCQSLTVMSPATSTRIARTAHESPVVAAIAIAATAMTVASTLVAMVIDPFRVPPSIAPSSFTVTLDWGRVSLGRPMSLCRPIPFLSGHSGAPGARAARRAGGLAEELEPVRRDERLKDPGELGEEQHAVVGECCSTVPRGPRSPRWAWVNDSRLGVERTPCRGPLLAAACAMQPAGYGADDRRVLELPREPHVRGAVGRLRGGPDAPGGARRDAAGDRVVVV